MRPRKKDRHLPACVYHKHKAYYLVKNGRWTRLGDDLKSALAEFARLQEGSTGGMVALIREAMPSITSNVKAATKDQYISVARRLEEIFSEFAPNEVMPKHIAQMRRSMADKPNMANRFLTVIRLVFNFALDEQTVEINPCIGIKRLEEGKRERLITPEEFDLIYSNAGERLQILMELWRLTGQRVTDVIEIKLSDIRDEGIYFKQKKTGEKLIVEWTDELHAAVDKAKAFNKSVKSFTTLLCGRKGKPLDYRTVALQWRKACQSAGVEDTQIRDLRAMSGTQADDQGLDATALLGHKSPAMTERYLRGRKVPVVASPRFKSK